MPVGVGAGRHSRRGLIKGSFLTIRVKIIRRGLGGLMVTHIDGVEMQPVRVRHAARAAEDIQLFELVSPDEADLPEFSAGAHLLVRTPNGLLRRYSIASDPHERDRYVIAVKREAQGGGGSV